MAKFKDNAILSSTYGKIIDVPDPIYGRTRSPYNRALPRNVYERRLRKARFDDIYSILTYQFLNDNAKKILVKLAKRGRFADFTGSLRYSYQAIVSIDNPNYPTVSHVLNNGDLSPITQAGYIRSTKKVWGRFKLKDKYYKNGKQRVVRRKYNPRYAMRQSGSSFIKVIDKRAGEDENSFGGTRRYNSYRRLKARNKRYLKHWESGFPYKADQYKYAKIVKAGSPYYGSVNNGLSRSSRGVGRYLRPEKVEAQLMIINANPASEFRNVRDRVFPVRRRSELLTNKNISDFQGQVRKVSVSLIEKLFRDQAYYNNVTKRKK